MAPGRRRTRTSCISRAPRRRPDRHSRALGRTQQGVLLRQLRGVALARPEHREPHGPASARRAGDLPLQRRRPDLREVNLLQLARPNGTWRRSIRRSGVLGDIRSAVTSGGTVCRPHRSAAAAVPYQHDTRGSRTYPTGRLDFNLTDKHRLSASMNYTDLLLDADTTNNREPNGSPASPAPGNQHSTATRPGDAALDPGSEPGQRVQGRRQRRRDAVLARDRPRSSRAPGRDQEVGSSSTSTATSSASRTRTIRLTRARGARGDDQDRREHAELAEGPHNIQIGLSFTGDVWVDNQQHVPTINFGVNTNDPARCSPPRTFTGASTAHAERRARAVCVADRPRQRHQRRAAPRREHGPIRISGRAAQRAQLRDYGFFLADTWRVRNRTSRSTRPALRAAAPFYPVNNSYSNATIADVCGLSGVATCGGCNLFQPGVSQPSRSSSSTKA